MMNYNHVTLTDNQNAFAYAMYMMVSSNFKWACCDSRITEEWLHFQYMQQKSNSQERMADMCAAYADTYLMNRLPELIWDERVYVVLDRDCSGLKRIFLEGTDFSMNIRTSFQSQTRAVVTCEFECLGEMTEYVTVIQSHRAGDISFRELDESGKHSPVKKQEPVKAKPVAAPVKARQMEGRADRIRSMLGRALAEGILDAPEPVQRLVKPCPERLWDIENNVRQSPSSSIEHSKAS